MANFLMTPLLHSNTPRITKPLTFTSRTTGFSCRTDFGADKLGHRLMKRRQKRLRRARFLFQMNRT
eukprot:scaffold37478_cov176-Amphora_coffeaeformis.AAC.2